MKWVLICVSIHVSVCVKTCPQGRETQGTPLLTRVTCSLR
jgi:hypothetical protein